MRLHPHSFYWKALLAAPIVLMSAPTVEHDGYSRRNIPVNSGADVPTTAPGTANRGDYRTENYRDRDYRYRDAERSYAYYGNGWAGERPKRD